MSDRVPTSGDTRPSQVTRSTVVIPVAAEEVTVQTRRRERGRVRITKTVDTDERTLDGTAIAREILVERVPIDRFVEEPMGARQEGDTLVIPVFEEVPVVVMKLKLKEEVRVTTRTTSQTRCLPVTVRRERVTIDRVGAPELREPGER
jgi:uncharacterized protein (TIGR02271 family)